MLPHKIEKKTLNFHCCWCVYKLKEISQLIKSGVHATSSLLAKKFPKTEIKK
jgi:hypothetical protein